MAETNSKMQFPEYNLPAPTVFEQLQQQTMILSQSQQAGLSGTEDNYSLRAQLRMRNGRVESSSDNILKILENDPNLAGRIRLDSFAHAIVVTDTMPWSSDEVEDYREWTNDDDSGLRWYLDREYQINSKQSTFDALILCARNNSFNPITDFLESLEWDEKPRVSTLLHDLLGADTSELTSAITWSMMHGALERLYIPGSKYDYMTVLCGEQGCGKSAFVRVLGIKPQWSSDSLYTFNGKEGAELLRGKWIVEVPELAAMKNTKSVETIKSFITRLDDVYRVPFLPRTERFPRTIIFIGTTNETDFLPDKTGGRRFFPVEVGLTKPMISIHSKEAQDHVIRVWAEALHFYKSGEKRLLLPHHLEEQIKAKQEQFESIDSREGIIKDYLDDSSTGPRVCVAMICEEALNMFDYKRSESDSIVKIMDNKMSSWRRNPKKQRCGKYGTQVCWERIS